MSLGSDNHSGVHPLVMNALEKVNEGYASPYGNDLITKRVETLFKEHFGQQSKAYLVLTGTGANTLSIKATCRSHEAVLVSEVAHLNCDESGAPEAHTGSKVLTVKSESGKLTVEGIKSQLNRMGNFHSSQPKLVSLTQCTELGTVYSLDELKALTEFCHWNDLLVHLDGARLSNAAASLGVSFREMTLDCGVDLVSLGGTKNGLLMGEAVVFLNPKLGDAFPWIRKQGMQLASKMRYMSAQFEAWFKDDLYLELASHSNQMAKRLAEGIQVLPGVSLLFPTQANEVFAALPHHCIEEMIEVWAFHRWESGDNHVRLVCSWDTPEEHVNGFIQDLASRI